MAYESETADGRFDVQATTALAVGAVLTIVGIAGYLLQPSEGLLFDVFGVNGVHNAVHVVTGLAGVAAGYYAAGRYADDYNRIAGLAYLGVFLLGVLGLEFVDALLNVNTADNVLHLGLAVVLAGVGFVVGDRR